MKSPVASSQSVSKSMKSNKSSGTKPELILAKLLRKSLYKNGLPGNPDFVYPKSNLAVFVHGCFWHRCHICNIPLPKTHRDYWRNKFKRNVERDRIVKRKIRSMGWRHIVVWEHEIRKDPNKVVNKIRKATGSLPTTGN